VAVYYASHVRDERCELYLCGTRNDPTNFQISLQLADNDHGSICPPFIAEEVLYYLALLIDW